ncbi:MAG TPA: selenocysteine-specific translation elongation factor [Herpetosiphonaceae bacterium]|nr:selenocysteine-specific translation elongation factor [Herpetosiphonaceae bacterium]
MYTIGTAGHVDHGKSTLVQALTGINPDRWEEERRREMTIDLGFAWLATPAGRQVSLVDVPGHERFIKNMLAGVGGLDAVLFVIAADEGVQPQTVEHRQIIDLLGLGHGLIVLTKRDLVDAEWLELMVEEVRESMRGSALADAPIIPVSARTGAGLPELLAALDGLLAELPGRSAGAGLPRLPIDRAFSVGGFGTVVTGTLLDGPFAVGDEVEVLPAGLRGRIRGIQTHQSRLDQARPGTRVAINLSGVERSAVKRGDVLSRPGALFPSLLVDVQLRMADSAPILRHNDPLDLFVGAAEVACHAALLGQETLPPSATGWVQLRLDAPIVVQRGDRCIVRRASPSQTLGGGAIIDPHPPRHRRFRPAVLSGLETLARGTPLELLTQALDAGRPTEWRGLAGRAGLAEDAARQALEAGCNNGDLLIVSAARAGAEYPDPRTIQPTDIIASAAQWANIRTQITDVLAEHHRRWPARRGIGREEVRSRLGWPARPFNAAVALGMRESWLGGDATFLHLPDHRPSLTDAQRRALAATLARWQAAPATPPGREAVDELDPELALWIIDSGTLVKVSAEVYLLPETYAAMRDWVERRLDGAEPLTLAAFRDAWATTRKYAQAFLEHMDELKVTRRAGEVRVRR